MYIQVSENYRNFINYITNRSIDWLGNYKSKNLKTDLVPVRNGKLSVRLEK